jgi:hypothetical protein
MLVVEPVRINRRAAREQRQCLWPREQHALDVAVEDVVEVFLGDLAERQHGAAAGVFEPFDDRPRQS